MSQIASKLSSKCPMCPNCLSCTRSVPKCPILSQSVSKCFKMSQMSLMLKDVPECPNFYKNVFPFCYREHFSFFVYFPHMSSSLWNIHKLMHGIWITVSTISLDTAVVAAAAAGSSIMGSSSKSDIQTPSREALKRVKQKLPRNAIPLCTRSWA